MRPGGQFRTEGTALTRSEASTLAPPLSSQSPPRLPFCPSNSLKLSPDLPVPASICLFRPWSAPNFQLSPTSSYPPDATTQAKTLVQKAILPGIWRSGRLAREF